MDYDYQNNFKIQMFEDKNSVNNFQITRNEKENSNNKLKAYFQNSSFLAQQEQLATFIKNLPIIRMDDVRSINKLIQILIKQNQMIGSKCQQNFITIKECYAKHDELVKKNRYMEQQFIEANRALEKNGAVQKQMQAYQEQLNKLKESLAEKVEAIKKINSQCDQLNVQNGFYHNSVQSLSEIIKQISQRNFKKSLDKVKQFNSPSKEGQLGWIDWNQLETFLKEQKKKIKYYPKIKETVELFCGRFLKISEYVPVDQMKDQYSKEVANLLEIIDDLLLLKKKNNLLSSQSRLTYSSSDYNFFEGFLDKALKIRETDSITKEQITKQLQNVKMELADSKRYYEQHLVKLKMDYESTIQKTEDELQSKNHIISFYEGEKEKITKDMVEMKNKIIEFQETLKAERIVSKIKEEDFINLENRLESVKTQYTLKEKEITEQWQENIKTYQYKLAQKQELLEEEQKLRKTLKQELQEKTNQFKIKIDQSEGQIKELKQSLKNLNNENNQLAVTLQNLTKKSLEEKAYLQKQLMTKAQQCQQMVRRIQKDMIAIKQLQEQIHQNEKEKSLQSEYIKQLEAKSTQLLSKIKTIQSKKSQEKTAKKQINAIKQTIIEEKKISKEMQDCYTAQKQQNQRLKGIIKQMKKQLEEVYLQFNHLKMIESDREKLILEIQKSDRDKEKLYRQFQFMKTELIKVDQENKTLAIEVKHYKNALSRIEALR